MEYKLSDEAIAQIAQLVQLGILTGTDVTDHLRTLRLDYNEKSSSLVPSETFAQNFKENLGRLVEQAESTSSLSTD